MRQLLNRLFVNLKEMERQVEALEQQICLGLRENAAHSKLEAIPRTGPITLPAR
jgi:transposase